MRAGQTLTFTTDVGSKFRAAICNVGQGAGRQSNTLIIQRRGLYQVYGQVTFRDHRQHYYTLKLLVNGQEIALAYHPNTPLFTNGTVRNRDKIEQPFRRNPVSSGHDLVPLPNVHDHQKHNFLASVAVGRAIQLEVGDRVSLEHIGMQGIHPPILAFNSLTNHFFGLYML